MGTVGTAGAPPCLQVPQLRVQEGHGGVSRVLLLDLRQSCGGKWQCTRAAIRLGGSRGHSTAGPGVLRLHAPAVCEGIHPREYTTSREPLKRPPPATIPFLMMSSAVKGSPAVIMAIASTEMRWVRSQAGGMPEGGAPSGAAAASGRHGWRRQRGAACRVHMCRGHTVSWVYKKSSVWPANF